MKSIILVALVALIVSCSTTKTKLTPGISNTMSPVEHDNLFTVLKHTGMDQYQVEKYISVANRIRKEFRSDCFKEELLKSELIQTNNKTNLEVYDHIQSSHTEIILNLYYKRASRVNGYTYPNSNTINLNNKFHSSYGVCSSSANLAHELTHKYGYGHDYKATRQRPKSVPYTVGRIINFCCEKGE